MSILEYVKSKPMQGINDWIKEIEKDGYSEYERLIIECADSLNKITINHNVNFKDTINL